MIQIGNNANQGLKMLKRRYSNKEFGVLTHAALHYEEYPVRIRREGSKSLGIECRDATELITEADLFFDEHPKKILEVFEPRFRIVPRRK